MASLRKRQRRVKKIVDQLMVSMCDDEGNEEDAISDESFLHDRNTDEGKKYLQLIAMKRTYFFNILK